MDVWQNLPRTSVGVQIYSPHRYTVTYKQSPFVFPNARQPVWQEHRPGSVWGGGGGGGWEEPEAAVIV